MSLKENVDVLLLNLPVSSWYKDKIANSNSMPPLGLLYVGTVLSKNGYKVKIIDCAVQSFPQDEIIKRLKYLNPEIVGMSTYNECWKSQILLVKLIKSILPNTKIVAGGAFATFSYKDILNSTETDFVIRGEGEYPMLELCNILLKKTTNNLNCVKGLVFKKDNGEFHITECERIRNLDKLPFPEHEFIDPSKYLIPFTISTTRGCPGDCIFCSSKAFWGKKVYTRSAENVFNEVLEKYNRYNNTIFYISDDTFTASTKRTFTFCKLLEDTKIKFIWGCESRADVITDKLIKRLSEAGCKKIQIGLESADNEVLSKIKKKITIAQIENGVKLAGKYGMHISVSFIIGHAFDTTDTIEKTLKFVTKIQAKYGAFVVGSVNCPFPGTEQYDKSDQLGLTIHSNDWNDYKLNSSIISTKNLTRKQIRVYFNQALEIMKNNGQASLKQIVDNKIKLNFADRQHGRELDIKEDIV